MKSKLLMVASSVVLGLAGAAALFAPGELMNSLASATGEASVALAQVLGALYFAFAMTNWMAKDNAIGGIYSRPLALGNFTHFAIGFLGLVRHVAHHPAIATATAIYAIFAVLFGLLLFGQGPVGQSARK